MSFFEQVNDGKTVDDVIQEIADNKTAALAVSRRDFSDEQYAALCRAIKESRRASNIFLSDIEKEDEIQMLFDSIAESNVCDPLKLTLQNTKMGDKYAKIFAEMYAKHPFLRDFFFKNTDIGDEGAEALAMGIVKKKSQEAYKAKDSSGEELAKETASEAANAIRSIRLNQNRIGNKGAKALAEAVGKSPKLNVFIVAGNQIEDEGMYAIADALSKSEAIEKVDVSGNPFSPSGAAALVAALRNKATLKEYAGFEI